MNLENLGKLLLFAGFFIVVTGGLIYVLAKGFGLDRFPGDILFRRGGFTFYFPLGLSVAVSLLLTILLNLFLRR